MARFPRPLRTALLTLHILTGAGWATLCAVVVTITLTDPTSPAATLLARRIVTPTAVTSLATGLALAYGTPWGLRRYRWVAVKAQISLVVIAPGLATLAGLLDPLSVLTARSCATLSLVAIIAISVAKPWGKTRHGRHRHSLNVAQVNGA
jgi:hypothetical protein